MGKKESVTKQDLRIAAFEMLYKKHDGRIGPRELLDAAQDSSSPLHDQFEWDDEQGGEMYRLAQAGQLIRRWRGLIVRPGSDPRFLVVKTERRVQSPVSSRGQEKPSYMSVEKIMADPELRADMLQTVLLELQSYRQRYAQLHELADVWAAFDDASGQYKQAKKRPPFEDRPPA